LSFSCGPDLASGGARVIDPNGFFVRATLDCAEPFENFPGDAFPMIELTDASADPLPTLREHLGEIPGTEAGDELAVTGYLDGRPQRLTVVVARGVSSIAALEIEVQDGARFYVGHEASCSAL
jgi:hypothetical protein